MNAELEKWMKVWDDAQSKDLFKDDKAPPPVVNPQTFATDYFGNVQTKDEKENVSLNECDTKYWKQVYQLSKYNSSSAPDVIKEQSKVKDDPLGSEPQGKLRELPSKDSLAIKGAELANTANPIYPDTRGEDQRKKVTPDWTDGEGLRELVEIKHKLYSLEVKLNSHPKFGAYGPESTEIKKIQTQIDEIKHKVDILSNSLSPDFVQQELS